MGQIINNILVGAANIADGVITAQKIGFGVYPTQFTLVADVPSRFTLITGATKFSIVTKGISAPTYIGLDNLITATRTSQDVSNPERVTDGNDATGAIVSDVVGAHLTYDYTTSVSRVCFIDISSTTGGTFKLQYSVSDGVTWVDLKATLPVGLWAFTATTFRYLRVARTAAGGNCVITAMGSAPATSAVVWSADSATTLTAPAVATDYLLAGSESGTPIVNITQVI